MPAHDGAVFTQAFADRQQAGRVLAEQVVALGLVDPVVLALPRGGVTVAAEVASALRKVV